ncbi:helix-turn-helix domain-containing protein [Bacillus pseudomycoides]|uniref:helix-turn-helix domain-containing protein n=1 Tax=Bacillus pseudomycoides TaxID=64104 RepID=UPI0020D23537|nr:helix-turn-helix domain-containing protein [Bacillus pseudomycoides]
MKVYTVKEMATALGKHEETIKRWLRSGKFPNAFRNSDKQGWKIPESDFVHIKKEIGFVKEDSQKSPPVAQQEVEEWQPEIIDDPLLYHKVKQTGNHANWSLREKVTPVCYLRQEQGHLKLLNLRLGTIVPVSPFKKSARLIKGVMVAE